MNQRYILATALLVWGWQSELAWFAVPMAIIVEARHFINRRWALTMKDFYQVANLTTLGLAGMIGFLFLNARTYHFITSLLQWLPIVFFGLTVVIAYSTTDRMRLDVLFHSLRRQKQPVTQSWDMDYFFLGICLLATGINNSGATFYFPYVAIMLGWALYPLRQQRYPRGAWVLIICLAFLLGQQIHIGLAAAQAALKAQSERWVANWIMRRIDPLHTATAIGQIGRLKLSDRIVFRIDSGDAGFPRLLREAAYDFPTLNNWEVNQPSFAVIPQADDFRWRLQPALPAEHEATVYLEFDRHHALVPLPAGIAEVDQLPALNLRRNDYGAIQASDIIPSPSFTIRYATGQDIAGVHSEADRVIPPGLREVLHDIAPDRDLAPAAAVHFVRDFFSDFSYSLYQAAPTASNPIESFLTQTRAGHCEYFASATALMLRHLGVPARYVVGYSVQEYNSMLNMYVVRQRHAHAWAEAWLDGSWVPVDTTPGTWVSAEADTAGALAPAFDFLNNAAFLFLRWWNAQKLEDYQLALFLIGTLLGIILIWRIYTSEQVVITADDDSDDRASFPGMDSPFFRIERHLASLGRRRANGESMRAWCQRHGLDDLVPILNIHQRLRFDPRGLAAAERHQFNLLVDEWIGRQTHEKPAAPQRSVGEDR